MSELNIILLPSCSHRIEKIWFTADMIRTVKRPMDHILKVLTGIDGSSVFETAARTSA